MVSPWHYCQPDAGSAQVKIWSATINPASAVSPASNAPATLPRQRIHRGVNLSPQALLVRPQVRTFIAA